MKLYVKSQDEEILVSRRCKTLRGAIRVAKAWYSDVEGAYHLVVTEPSGKVLYSTEDGVE